MKRARRTVLALVAIIGGLFTGPANAALGDSLASFDASATAGIPACASGVGTGVAFDGVDLILSCWGSNVLQRVNAATHANDGALTIAGASDLGAIAYDGGRDELWACSARNTVVLIDLAASAVDPTFPAIPVAECVDGLAYDGSDDTLWLSPDVSSTNYHYQLDGTLIASFSNSGKLGGCGNSGIAVGGDKLYLANNGCSQIFQVTKDFSSSALISTFPRRLEDLECDEITFAPKAAIWSNDAYDRVLNAWEIPAGSCAHGGGVLPCTDLAVEVTRPMVGKNYVDDVDAGSSGTGTAVVQGTPLTVTADSTNVPATASIEFLFDGASLGVDTTAPYAVTFDATAPPGPHTIEAIATHTGENPCRQRATVPIEIQCFGVTTGIDRPVAGRTYLNDTEVGPSSDPEATTMGGPLTARATSSDPMHTDHIDLLLDTDAPITASAPPYEATFDTDALATGLHLITATLAEKNTACTSVATLPLRRIESSLQSVAKGLTLSGNIPIEPQLHAGGVMVGPQGGSSSKRIANLNVPPVVDSVHAITDSASGARGLDFSAEGDSLVTDVSLLGGLITADVLHARARATYAFDSATASVSDAGTAIANLRIGGTPVTVTQPNTVVPLPGGMGTVVIEETLPVRQGARAELTVNMIHAYLDTPSIKGELIVGSAFAALNGESTFIVGPDADRIHRPDDAGAKRDAGNDLAAAVSIEPGTYSGALTPGDDRDVYSFQAGQGDRIEIIVKPAEREVATIQPGPVPTTTGPVMPMVSISLYDPDHVRRAVGDINIGTSLPQRVELNADKPYAPAGARGPWTLQVDRAGAEDGFYTLELSLLPELLRDQNDGGATGDAPDTCTTAGALAPTPTAGQEIDQYTFPGVIRDADTADFYAFPAKIGQLVTIAMKPDELADGADFDLELYGPSTPGGAASCASPTAVSMLGKYPVPKGAPEAIEMLPVEMTGTYALGVVRANAVGNYYLTATVANPLPTIAGNDAGLGSDASDACSSATPLSVGAYQARLGDVPADDRDDWFAIDLAAGQDLTAVMKPSEVSDFDLELYRPDCTPAPADRLTMNHQSLSAPETVHIADATAGAWRIRVDRNDGGGNYMLGVITSP